MTGITLIAAVAENGVIGRAGGMPWRLKADFAHFRKRTMGKPVVMGRRTYESIGRPLDGRTTIVVSRDRALTISGVVVAPSLAHALETARGEALRRGVDKIMVAGGADIYSQSIGLADTLDITHVQVSPEGDTCFPRIESALWREIERNPAPGEAGMPAFAWVTYERNRNPE